MRNASPTDIHNLLRDVGQRGLAAAAPPPPFNGPDGDEEFRLAEFWAMESIAQLEHAVRSDDYATRENELVAGLMQEVRDEADQLATRYGPFRPGDRLALLQGIARGHIERERQYLHRLSDRVVPYAPEDPLFTAGIGTAPSLAMATRSISFEGAVEAYVRAKRGVVWTPRTEHENRKILGLAAEHFGPLRKLGEITKDDVRAFRDGLLTWRIKPPSEVKLRDLLDAPEDKRISSITAAKYFGYLTSAFGFWVDEGHLPVSPAGKMSVKVPKGRRIKPRESFGDTDLATLFNSPMYVGCAGPHDRMTPGARIIADGYYWVPLVAALSGMRVTEIVQLLGDDIDTEADVPAMRIRGDTKTGQKVKSEAGWRSVPIHRRLIELGFLDFIVRRQARGGSERIFHDVTQGSSHAGAGAVFSQWFGRRMDALKLSRPGLVFHSFRHRFTEELRENTTPSYALKAIIGHSGRDVTDGYGGKPSLALCKKYVDQVRILDALPPVNSRLTEPLKS